MAGGRGGSGGKGGGAMKSYYFICRDCGKRNRSKPDSEESIRPGLCKVCYNKRFDEKEKEVKGEQNANVK